MKRLIVLGIFVFAAWYGWKHQDSLRHPEPHHQAMIRNDTGEKLVRIRLTVGGHTYVKKELFPAQSATIPFAVNSDSKFDLVWEFETNTVSGHWTGGLVTKGPLIARHTMTIRAGGGVIFETQNLEALRGG